MSTTNTYHKVNDSWRKLNNKILQLNMESKFLQKYMYMKEKGDFKLWAERDIINHQKQKQCYR